MSTNTDREEGELSDGEPTDETPFNSRSIGRTVNARSSRRNPQTNKHERVSMTNSRKTAKRSTVLEGYRRASSSTPLLLPVVDIQQVSSYDTEQTVTGQSSSPHGIHGRKALLGNSKSYNGMVTVGKRDETSLQDGPSSKLNNLDLNLQKQKAKYFLSMLHQNNYGFEELIAEELDPSILRSIFRELQIPVDEHNSGERKRASSILSSDVSLSAASQLAEKRARTFSQNLLNKSTHAVENGSTASKFHQTTLDREDYVARLMAAKNKKPTSTYNQGLGDGASGQVNTREASNRALSFNGSIVDTASKEIEDKAVHERRRAQTELAKLRIEALQAKRTAKPTHSIERSQHVEAYDLRSNELATNSKLEKEVVVPQGKASILAFSTKSTSMDCPSPKFAKPSLFDFQLDPTHRVSLPWKLDQSSAMIASPVQIPGLSSTEPPQSQGNEAFPRTRHDQGSELDLPFAPQAISSVRKRPVAADFDDGAPMIMTKRPFGRLRDHNEPEDIVIEVSDDESIRSEKACHTQNDDTTSFEARRLGLSNEATIIESLDYSHSQNQPSANVSLLDDITIFDSVKHSKDLKRQEQEIDLMKKKIAELEVKRKARSGTSSAGTPGPPFAHEYSADVFQQDSFEHSATTKLAKPHSVVAQIEDPKIGEDRIPLPNKLSPPVIPPNSNPVLTLKSHRPVISPSAPIMSQDFPNSAKAHTGNNIGNMSALNASTKPSNHIPPQDLLNMDTVYDSQEVYQECSEFKFQNLDPSKSGTGLHFQPISQSCENQSLGVEDAEAELADRKIEQISDGVASSMSFSADDARSTVPSIDEATGSCKQQVGPHYSSRRSDEAGAILSSSEQMLLDSASDFTISTNASASEKNTLEGGTDHQVIMLQRSDPHIGTDDQDDCRMDESSSASSEIIQSSASDSGLGEAIRDFVNASDELTSMIPSAIASPGDSADTSFLMSDEEYEPSHDRDKGLNAPENSQPDEEDYEPPEIPPSTGISTNDIAIQVSHLKPGISPKLHHSPSTGKDDRVGPIMEYSFAEDKHEGNSLFSPYDSPLKMFKSFRYHPKFLSTVPNGFRSLTYSHAINPNQPLCPFEAAGGACNDGKCAHQHFRNMQVGDETILLQLGSRNPGRSGEEIARWTEGLRQMIQDLRSKKITDAEVVASEISSYRRRFFNDVSRVLDL